ncbi:MAG TPA: hypothetical protein VF627_08895 [Abditibacterium sp.]|jgi:PBP1b-binding outer membrane lipoprotein LpoB
MDNIKRNPLAGFRICNAPRRLIASSVLMALALAGCSPKEPPPAAPVTSALDAETQKVLDNPNASAAEKQAAAARIQSNPKLIQSDKMNLLQRLK